MTREEAIKVLRNTLDRWESIEFEDLFGKDICAINMAINALENERPEGHWILSQNQDKEDTDNGNYRFECSNCGYSDTHSKATEVPYCWHCGADMRGKSDD